MAAGRVRPFFGVFCFSIPSPKDLALLIPEAGLQPEEEAWTVAGPSGQDREDAGSAAS